jgi:hypothetical protein
MNFHGTGTVHMAGTPLNYRPLRCCDKCGKRSEEAGGVQKRPGLWVCSTCWRKPAKTKRKS